MLSPYFNNEIIYAFIICTGTDVFVCIHDSPATGFCLVAWQHRTVYYAGDRDVFFKEDKLLGEKVKIKNS